MAVNRRLMLESLAAAAGSAMMGWPLVGSAQAAAPLAAQPWARWDPATKPVRGGTLRLAEPLYIGNLNPNRWPVNDWVNMNLIHDKLVIGGAGYRPGIPYLAESVVREGSNAALMTLRPGIQFHDGTPLDAEAVKAWIGWIRDPSNAAFTLGWIANLDAIEVTGPLTLRWKFKDAWAAFEGVVGSVPGYAISPTALKKDAKRFETVDPKGVGAYMVEEASPGNFLRLKRNPNWWLAKALGRPDMPYFDNVLISVVPDPAVRLANFRAGKIDLIAGLERSQYALIKADRNVDVYVNPRPTTYGYRMNAVKGPCADPLLRKAIRHAIDVKALIAGTQHGLGRVASGLYPGDHFAHNPELKPSEFNPQLSRWLLQQAKLDKGVTIRGYVSNVPAAVEVAEAVKNMLAQVGIQWQVDALSPVAADARRKSLDWDLAPGGWSWIYDADPPMTGLYHPKGSFAEGRTEAPERTAMIEAARRETSPDKREAIYRELEKRVNDEYFDVWLWWDESPIAVQKWVRGWDHRGLLEHKEAWFFSHPLWFANGKPGRGT